jgi:hypothetical protein
MAEVSDSFSNELRSLPAHQLAYRMAPARMTVHPSIIKRLCWTPQGILAKELQKPTITFRVASLLVLQLNSEQDTCSGSSAQACHLTAL